MTTRRHIEEHVIPGHRLGRHVEHDPRSLNFLVRRAVVIRAVKHRRYIPILDQGDLGSCTGNAGTGALGTAPVYGTTRQRRAAGVHLDEPFAVSLYSAATRLDGYPGEYPPDDTGSSGLAVAKALKAQALIAAYNHATSLDLMNSGLQIRPVIVGVNWYDSFDTPDSGGHVTITPGAQVRGGHEFVVRGTDPTTRTFWCDNSWSAAWGLRGSFIVGWDDMGRLLSEQGDCTQFVPLGSTV